MQIQIIKITEQYIKISVLEKLLEWFVNFKEAQYITKLLDCVV